ncbi:hypothetical protein FRC0126_00160 [Corynebacterium diphtheriae]|nr:hypothetical protein A6J36_08985 [Corynebacterium diphtheriae]OWM46486.1 hypothetical protein BU160_05520 [Corynebacterium diphtheriae]OWM55618.1 hypothetical protein BU167_04675 [Corynebacterium diphtheriae]OWM57651.1 hypothetical protein BU162_02035 [Corynebacterium diphtheriae]OWM60579.1 hypothetical protein BU165_06610 [Corynebacterium diphtheriae]
MTTGKDTHDCDYFTSLFLLPQLCNSTFQGHMGQWREVVDQWTAVDAGVGVVCSSFDSVGAR